MHIIKYCYPKHEEFLKLNNKKMSNQIKKWAKDLNRLSHERRYTDGK